MKPLIITAMLGVLLAGYVVADSPTAPDIGWPVVRIPEPEASEYVDGARVHRMPPGPDRWKERSRTFEGIAAAMASQWGRYAMERTTA